MNCSESVAVLRDSYRLSVWKHARSPLQPGIRDGRPSKGNAVRRSKQDFGTSLQTSWSSQKGSAGCFPPMDLSSTLVTTGDMLPPPTVVKRCCGHAGR